MGAMLDETFKCHLCREEKNLGELSSAQLHGKWIHWCHDCDDWGKLVEMGDDRT